MSAEKSERDELFYALRRITNQEIDFFRRHLSTNNSTLVTAADQTAIWGVENASKSLWDPDDGQEERAKEQKTTDWRCIVNRLNRGIFKSSVDQFTARNPLPNITQGNLGYLKGLDAKIDKRFQDAGDQVQQVFGQLEADHQDQYINARALRMLGVGSVCVGGMMLLGVATAATVIEKSATALLTSSVLLPMAIGLGLIILGCYLIYAASQRENTLERQTELSPAGP